jgi:hypothetical protein
MMSSEYSGETKTGGTKTAKQAAEELARLMERQLGYQEGHIDSVAFRLFIKAYWSRVSMLAHAIHNAEI